jgi:hypothetical protein
MELTHFFGTAFAYSIGLLVGYYFGYKEIPYGYLVISLLSFIVTYFTLGLIFNVK